ncbi:hypothetical protein MHH28_13600 [Paenibacillus sp. FSL K6-1217]|uniref:hypothetical protein n=1 Tax=Paenibacillus sp. FSL K6-1217 TaxID=2921466 RepID=UPI003245BA58
MRKVTFTLLFVIFLTACGSSKSGITPDDISIVKVDDEKAIVTYGMSRTGAEKVVGEPEDEGIGSRIRYNNGISITYRDNSVVFISLNEESKGKFKTVDGAEINMNKNDFKKIYGEDKAVEAPDTLNYVYDSEKKEYVNELKPDQENAKYKKYLVSVKFNDKGEADLILVSDINAALYLH